MLKLFILTFFISGCVGTVDTNEKEQVYYTTKEVARFNYEGITNALAIAHDKIEVDFFAYSEEDNIDHYLYVNDANTPIKLNLKTLVKNPDGSYKYILRDLNTSQPYKLTVKAQNNITGAKSENESDKILTTFNNEVADFLGVANVRAVPGSGFKDAVVEWNPATFRGSITNLAFDPDSYEITYTDKGPEYLDNPEFSKKINVPNVSVGNQPASHPITFERSDSTLDPADTTYYVRVRAIHSQWAAYKEDDPLNIPVKREMNNVIFTYNTLPRSALLSFDKQSVIVAKNYIGGENAGFESLKITWSQANGIYIGHRIIIRKVSDDDVSVDKLGTSLLNNLHSLTADNDDFMLLDATTTPVKTCQYNSNSDLGIGTINVNDKYVDTNNPDNKAFCIDIAASKSGVILNNLDINSNYQIKVAVCPNSDCSLAADGGSVVSSFKLPQEIELQNGGVKIIPGSINTTFPELASFYGINSIQNPSDILDRIHLKFPPVSLSEGYADGLKVYCASDSALSDKVVLNGVDASTADYGSGHVCNGLKVGVYLNGLLKDISDITYTSFANIKQIAVNSVAINQKYCFAVTPYIDSNSIQDEIEADKLVVRCITPEIITPTISEFSGINNSQCSVNNGNVSFSWKKPEGGMFDDYIVFFKKKTSTPFKFADAINDSSQTNYTRIEGLGNKDDLSFNLILGENIATSGTTSSDIKIQDSSLQISTEYQFGVLTRKAGSGGPFYSEGNASIATCYLPKPKATFNEWTRVFAIGPKIDGSIPKAEDSNNFPVIRYSNSSDEETDNAHLYETLNQHGIPKQVTSNYSCSSNNAIPGESNCRNKNFVSGESNTLVSKNGIVSLAWKPVSLDFSDITANQDSSATTRQFGYRVYRSEDNGQNWKNLTENNNYVHAIDYQYRKHANAAIEDEDPTTSGSSVKMAFFTDFSVEALHEENGVAKARVYLYKIVPIYQGEELQYDDDSLNPHHIIKVTLPPENMALVHRKMANRTFCRELDLPMDFNNHYRCDYNGLGSRPKEKPWRVGESVIDLGGDLLVDRFELGCNYTRGDRVAGDATDGRSYFDDGNGYTGPLSSLTIRFSGQSSNFAGAAFRGCLAPNHFDDSNANDTSYNAYSQVNTNSTTNTTDTSIYDSYLHGDCRGRSMMNAPAGIFNGSTWYRDYYLPGLGDNAWDGVNGGQTFTTHPAYSTTNTDGILSEPVRGRALLAQAEHMAVFYNTHAPQMTGRYTIFPLGPSGSIAENSTQQMWRSGSPTCYINLASIDQDSNWYSRWVNISDVEVLKNGLDVTSTVADVHNANGLYGLDNSGRACPNINTGTPCTLSTPAESTWNKDRFNSNMPLARIFSNNASNLPPLNVGSPETMQKICSTYKVSVGVFTNNNFITQETKQKRMLRRNEFVIAGKYPESYADSTNSEEADAAPDLDSNNKLWVTNIEGSTTVAHHACNSIGKTNQQTSGSVGDNLFADTLAFFTSNTGVDTFFATGSSDSTNSTKNCMSKYGIQDLAGNVPEKTSEKLICGYGDEQVGIYYGTFGLVVDGVPIGANINTSSDYRNLFAPSNTTVAQTSIAASFKLMAPYPADAPENDETVVEDQADLCLANVSFPVIVTYNDGSTSYDIPDSENPCGVDTNGNAICTRQNVFGWDQWCFNHGFQATPAAYLKRVQNIATAGYCSVNDDKPDRLRQATQNIFNESNVFVKNIFKSQWQGNYVLDIARSPADDPDLFAVSYGDRFDGNGDGLFDEQDIQGAWDSNGNPIGDGVIDDTIDLFTSIDPQGLDYARNSDGTFLNFGSIGQFLALPMLVDNYKDSNNELNYALSFQKDSGAPNYKAQYFSPLFGIPLQCGSNSIGSCGGVNASSKLVTLSTFNSNFSNGLDSSIQLSNYPVGNSDGTNQGIDQVRGTGGDDTNGNPITNDTSDSAGEDLTSGFSPNPGRRYYTGFVIDDESRLVSSNIVDHQVITNQPIDYRDLRWIVRRGSNFYFDNGGTGVDNSSSGVLERMPAGSLSINANSIQSGFTRCGVMINEE